MDQGQLDALYQQYLGRNVDPNGLSTWGNADYNTVVQGILGSQEYQNRQQQSAPAPAQSTQQEPPPSWLLPADYQANGYAAPYTQSQITQKVDPSWIRQMNGQTYASVKGPSDLSGGEYLVDPNTGKFALDKNGNPIGVTYPQSNGFSDWVTTPLGSLALTFGVPLAAMGGVAALEGLGAATGAGTALETTGAGGLAGGGAFTPAAGSGASFAITPGAAYTAASPALMTTKEILASTGFTPAAGSGANFVVDPTAAYTLSDAAAAAGLANAGYSASQIANLAKTGLSLSSIAAKLLGGSGSTTTGSATNPLSNALRNIVPTTATTGTQSGTNFGLMKGNVNPFMYAKDIPTQTVAASKADPFAALNVPQTPIQPYNPLAHLVG